MFNSQQTTSDTEMVAISLLKNHSKNYRIHPDDQIDHLMQSIKEFGFYRRIVIANDNTILAGHGVSQAAKKMGIEFVPVVRIDIDPHSPKALKLLAGDNEIQHLVETDDRALTELLKNIKDTDVDGLLGTGYNDQQLAALLLHTRPESEIKNMSEAAAWANMPGYEQGEDPFKIIILFRNDTDRDTYTGHSDLEIHHSKSLKVWSTWWPSKQKEDVSSVKFE